MHIKNQIIAAVRNDEEFDKALASKVGTIFFLHADIMELQYAAQRAHEKDKKILIHIDLTTGIGKDRSGVEFAKSMGVDGIVSTKTALIKVAKEVGMMTVQRFFLVDSQAIDTTVETVKSSKADMIEVMPGIAPKLIEKLKKRINTPIIAGGMIENEEEAGRAIQSGATAISTGRMALWNL